MRRLVTGVFKTDPVMMRIKNILYEGLAIDLKVVNITDATYFQPGLREADSGNTPGSWQSNGLGWNGSAGLYNSELPQPRLFMMLGISLNF